MGASVVTTAGPVRGAEDARGVWSFKGIPYAADTSGDGRFRPPRPVTPWTDVREATAYGPSCPQMTIAQMTGQEMPPGIEEMMGVLRAERETSEDCLVLNVWTPVFRSGTEPALRSGTEPALRSGTEPALRSGTEPALDSGTGRPVLVWLHGGGWTTGSASWPLYEFDNLAGNNDVVVVGVNHRLGILGFLDLSGLGEEFADSGNVGMLDVVAALEWIRDNIAEFGGDPGNVTVFGESGGGAKTSALLAMPAASGLFHRAFPMSGALLTAQTHDTAADNTATALEHLGLGFDADKLRAVEVERLVEAELAVHTRGPGGVLRMRGFSPVLGPSLPAHPVDAIRAGSARDVPVVMGCTTDEMMSFLLGDPELWSLGDDGLATRLGAMLGDDAEAVLGAYRAAAPDDSPTSLMIAITSDRAMRVPHVRLAEAKIAGGGEPVFMYLFAWGHPDPTGRVRAGHGSDMPFFFDNVDKAPASDGPQAAPLVAATSGALVALARSGDPNHAGLVAWPPYTLDQRPTMWFDVESRVVPDPLAAQRRAWDGVDAVGMGA